MRRTLRSLTDAREELVQIEEQFTRLQERIGAVGDFVSESSVRLFGERHAAFTGWQEEDFIERVAGSIIARLEASSKPQVRGDKRYLRLPDVKQITGLSRSAIYKRIAEGSFPNRVSLGSRAVAWRESDIENWVKNLPEKV